MHVASLFGIPVRVHWSYVLLTVGGVGFGWYRGPLPVSWLVFLAVAMSLCVVLHELGHALAARRFGIGTDNITLYPMGGVASIERMPEEPDQELIISIAGPAVNFVLAAITGWAWLLTEHPLAMVLAGSNLFMGLFNLLPAFPMDGGRVLRALLAKRMGWLPASRLAVRIGRVFAWAFIVVGAWWGQYTLPMIGIFLHVALNSEKERLVALHWERTTGRPPPWVGAVSWSLDPGILLGHREPPPRRLDAPKAPLSEVPVKRSFLIGAGLGAVVLASLAAAPSGPTVAVNNGPNKGATAGGLTPQPYEKDIEAIVGEMLEDYHYLKHPVDDEMSRRWLDNYIDQLDYGRTIFLQSDIDEFHKFSTQLDDDLHAKPPRLDLPLKIFARYSQRIRERVQFEQTLLAKPLDLTNAETFDPDRHEAKLAWPSTAAQANELWRKRTEEEMIEALTSDDTRDTEADLRARFSKRYASWVKDVSDRESIDVLETWLDALTQAYDPHSAWLKPARADDFSIEITNSVQGIGAQLKTDDDYTTVSDLVLGGPAEKDHRLRKDDRILTVAQGDSEPVDVVGMRIDKVVKLIRGEKGTIVKLDVQHKDGERELVDLVRDQVMLEDSAAKAHLETVNGHKLGVVLLPGFYVDPEGRKGGHRASEDVKRELLDLQAQGAEGVILDLRGNGGGSLIEAIDVAGLFLPGGPVVQVRSRDGQIEALPDSDSGYAWAGPMIVMTDATSASASEIVAGALQDYGRALVVGDESTHGKGSVQQIAELTQQLKGRYTEDVGGELKITVQKFYRVSGGSTQNKGVEADVVLPSGWDGLDVHEGDLDYAMPWDQIPPAPHVRTGNYAPLLPELRSRSAARVASSEDYQRLGRELAMRADDKAHPEVSLVLADRKTEIAARKAKIGMPDEPRDQDETLTPEQREQKLREKDFGLDEGLAVLADLLTLQKTAGTPGPPK